MHEHELQDVIAAVKAGRMSRRAFVRKIVGLGLTAPFATQLLAQAGLAQAPTNAEYKPTNAGGGASARHSSVGLGLQRVA
jgi:peptide/nickel transport system substrate-binding protein